ncbi:MAG TPA: HAD family phosphatase [Anaerolineaceae bacterium]
MTGHQKQIKAVIFDLGGVLVRTETQEPRIRLAKRLGISPERLYDIIFNSPSNRLAEVGKITSVAHWDLVRQALGVSPGEIGQIRSEFFEGDILDRDLLMWIKALRSQVKVGILSNAMDDLRQRMDELQPGVLAEFDEVAISAEMGIAKPDMRAFLFAVDRLGVRPWETLFIDDMLHNIEGAEKAGLVGLRFQSSDQVKEDVTRWLIVE